MTALFAGIGVVRIVWIPLFDIEPDLLNAAIVIGFPSLFVLIPPLHFFYGLYMFFMFLLIPVGFFISIFGVVTWFYGKIQGKTIINFWIYKYSRHPQYVGLILFNYGLLIFLLVMFKIMETTLTLPWLSLTLIIIGMAITEENNLLRAENEEFITWRKKTPFMIPIPKVVTSFILFPMKIILKKDWPENNKEIIITLLLYGLILVFLSLPLIPLRREMTDFYNLIRIIF